MRPSSLINTWYALDPRALALTRIAIGLISMLDLCIRATDLELFYSEKGMWPSEIMYNLGWQPGFWTIHALTESLNWTISLFGVHFLAALSLTLGFWSRTSTVMVYVLYVSLHNRNLFILQSGDDLLRLSLFLGIFLGWGRTLSWDARGKHQTAGVSSLSTLAYLLLLASVYLFTALLKNDKEWHGEGSALYYALSLDQLRLYPVGNFLYEQSTWLPVLTFLVYITEIILPLLILWPSKNGGPRLAAFVLIFLLHLCIGLTLYVGLFFLISIATALVLIPGHVFDRFQLFRHYNWASEIPPSAGGFRKNLRSGFLLLVIFLCALINFGSLPWFPYQANKELRWINNVLRLNQYWGMFSPGILKKDGWLVYHGVDSLGRQWDLRENSDFVVYDKPKRIVSLYRNDRQRKLAENMQNEKFTFLRPLYTSYCLKKWNREHPEKPLKTLNLYFMEQETLPNYIKTLPKKILYAVSTTP